MKAVRARPPGVEVVDVDEPDGPGVLVQIRAASICKSDFAYLEMGSTHLLGHELAGVMPDGTNVAIEGIFSCGSCELCARGNANLCATMSTRALGFTASGGMSEWFRVPEAHLVPLPPALDVENASLVEPASVAWHGLRSAALEPGQRVVVIGGGAIGLLAVAAARRMGAAEVALESRHGFQREAGERVGAVSTGGDYDVVVEAAGSESAIHRGAELARPGATMVLLGLHGDDHVWPYGMALLKELRVVSSIGYCHADHGHDFAEVAAMLAAEPELVSALITHRFPLEDAVEAFRVADDTSTGALRVVLQPS